MSYSLNPMETKRTDTYFENHGGKPVKRQPRPVQPDRGCSRCAKGIRPISRPHMKCNTTVDISGKGCYSLERIVNPDRMKAPSWQHVPGYPGSIINRNSNPVPAGRMKPGNHCIAKAAPGGQSIWPNSWMGLCQDFPPDRHRLACMSSLRRLQCLPLGHHFPPKRHAGVAIVGT